MQRKTVTKLILAPAGWCGLEKERMRDPSEKTSPNFLAGRACADLGSSGIKFEVEGGEGSPGADTYIPPPKNLPSCFIFHRNLRFCSIF